jgi:hypothetical protein
MRPCEAIATMSQAYLDDELASDERREFELHLLDCASCSSFVDVERRELVRVRALLRDAPRAPAVLRERICDRLTEEDRRGRRQQVRRHAHQALVGVAAMSAAVALAMFVCFSPRESRRPAVVSEATRQAANPSVPLEVQGASTTQWLQNAAPAIAPPPINTPLIEELGARLTAVDGHDAVMLALKLRDRAAAVPMTGFIIKGVRPDEFDSGAPLNVDGVTVRVYEDARGSTVAFVSQGNAFVFIAPLHPATTLVDALETAGLIQR